MQSGSEPMHPQVKEMLLNHVDLFNSHISYGSICHKHLICILHTEHARLASLSHQMFIPLIILWYSNEHFHRLTPSESSAAEPLMSAAIIN